MRKPNTIQNNTVTPIVLDNITIGVGETYLIDQDSSFYNDANAEKFAHLPFTDANLPYTNVIILDTNGVSMSVFEFRIKSFMPLQNEYKSENVITSNQVSGIQVKRVNVLTAISLAASQEPGALGTPLQLEFGGAQSTDLYDLAVDGTLTLNKNITGQLVRVVAQVGRTGGAGESKVYFYGEITPFGGSTMFSPVSRDFIVDNERTRVPVSAEFPVEFLPAGSTIKFFIVRDDAGDDSGGIYNFVPTIVTHPVSPCATLEIFKYEL